MAKDEFIFSAAIVTIMIIAIVSISSCIERSVQKEKKEIEEKRKTLSAEEIIIFDAEQKPCTKRTGSRPSCWSDEDWELFFYKYCQRIKCE